MLQSTTSVDQQVALRLVVEGQTVPVTLTVTLPAGARRTVGLHEVLGGRMANFSVQATLPAPASVRLVTRSLSRLWDPNAVTIDAPDYRCRP